MENIILEARNTFSDVHLTNDYRIKRYRNNFQIHLNTLFDISNVIVDDSQAIFNDTALILTDRIYHQTEGFVIESLDDLEDESINEEFDNLQGFLYEKIRRELGMYYDRTSLELLKMIDRTVHSAILSVKYNYFSKCNEFINPWESENNIFTDNKVLHLFSTNRDEVVDFIDDDSNESNEISDKKIWILAKGHRSDTTHGFVRDLLGLRNTILAILDESASSYRNPMKTEIIIRKLRQMGISQDEYSDSNIKNWLITPLKRNNRIGSSKDGYFMLNTCDDIAFSYGSHLENLKGYFRTLESHRRLAEQKNCLSTHNLNEHIEFLLRYLNLPS
ncbi:hypothetical protein FMM05_06355 [Flavobacterium zepuense]|uniref:Uncharacterized protein n=1 Tax=Flavobacterium zepuense TaxID=2593302 RepID=A0A552V5T3_9FLAO|nr:hypothetical protein [Flavobacterium zepuense]TRW25840.1 hypothetical protein FMM05_06355 [Flavobacterium zepuense]